MIRFCNRYRVVALMVVSTASDTQKFTPIVDLRRTIGMHGAMNDDGVHTIKVWLRNAADIVGIIGVCKALVMDHDVESLGPFRIFVPSDHGFRSFATFVDDRPLDWESPFFCRQLQRFRLKIVVVATSSRNEQDRNRLGIGIPNGARIGLSNGVACKNQEKQDSSCVKDPIGGRFHLNLPKVRENSCGAYCNAAFQEGEKR